MRTVLAFLLALGVVGADLEAVPDRVSKKDLVKAEIRRLQGNWVMVRWQRAGSVVVYNAGEKFYVWTIRGDKLTARQGGLGWQIDAAHTIDPTAEPRTLDAVERRGPNQGKTGRYIYHLDGDTLTVCHAGLGQARPKDFTGKGAANPVVITFNRVKP
jgi:uncharacterized protein (TIGR03067 family)